MTPQQITQTLQDYLADQIGHEEIAPDTEFFEEGLVSSLFAIQLMSFLETTFGIEITMDDLDLDNFKSIERISDFITAKQAA